jgi:hypothetical protein
LGYGVVGFIATLGLVFAGRQWTRTEAERAALQKRVEELSDRLLTQAEKHKAELLAVYQAVGPALASTAETLASYREFLARQRHDDEIAAARAEGADSRRDT